MHDSHIHLAMEPLKSNSDEVIHRFIQEGGKHILTQGTDIVDFDDNFQLAKIQHGRKRHHSSRQLVFIQHTLKKHSF